MKANKIIAAALLMIAVPASAETSRFTPANTFVIGTEITGASIRPVMDKMLDALKEESAVKELNIIIHSPGGSVYAGSQMISVMEELKAGGVKINCYVPGLAASMAFQILVHCDTRTVLEGSALLWHRARVMLPGIFGAIITGPEAQALANDLEPTDNHILSEVNAVLQKDMSKEEILYHFNHETLHVGKNLCTAAPHFCTSKVAVPGLIAALSREDLVKSKTEPNLMQGMIREGIVYVWSRYFTGGK